MHEYCIGWRYAQSENVYSNMSLRHEGESSCRVKFETRVPEGITKGRATRAMLPSVAVKRCPGPKASVSDDIVKS